MQHFTDPDFRAAYRLLPNDIRLLADKNYALLRIDPRHPLVRLKKVGVLYSARVGLHYRALTKERPDGLQWFWIGHHATYDRWLAEG